MGQCRTAAPTAARRQRLSPTPPEDALDRKQFVSGYGEFYNPANSASLDEEAGPMSSTTDNMMPAPASPNHRPGQTPLLQRIQLAVLIPCHNEAATISKVVTDFRRALPGARIVVYDNNSTDSTATHARQAGAAVFHETAQGKGNVVRRMFRDVDADFYILVDGDDTYDAGIAPQMITEAAENKIDFVNCVRTGTESQSYRFGHRFGNKLLTGIVQGIFGAGIPDMLSGYKVLSRRFVKSFPVLSNGFDFETEMAVHALELSLPVMHVSGIYRGRPQNSVSKLNTCRDGLRILWFILVLIKHERPLPLFGAIAGLLVFCSLFLGIPVILSYLSTGLVPRLPTAVLATGLAILAALSGTTGLILDTVTRGRREARLLAYLRYPATEP
jgi:glycosyltransferase involved in cell wall biosynthesis